MTDPSDILKLRERVDIALELGESHYREFKSALEGKMDDKRPRDLREVCQDIAKTLVAFANADGGELFVGIEDDGQPSGLHYKDDKVKMLLESPKSYVMADTPLPLRKAHLIQYNDLKIAFFAVDKGVQVVHLTVKGECFQRKDRESVPTASEKIRFAREEETSREYDRHFVELANINDLDMDLLQRVASVITRGMSAEKCLQYLDLAEYGNGRLNLRRATLLLFAKNINKWHPRSQVRILKVKGSEERYGQDFNVEELATVSGNVFELALHAWDALRPYLTETRLSQDAVFKTQILYPELACREALINAITHRDYSVEGRGIEIRIFDDRLEVLSPGSLLSSITIQDLEELRGVHQSRNTYLGRTLREYGFIRELGEGIRRMFDLMNQNELVPPKIASQSKSFVVTLFHKHQYSREEKIWLEHFKELNLTRDQKIILRLGIHGRLISPQQIFDNVGIVDTEQYRQLLQSLMDLGVLHSVVSRVQAQNKAKSMKTSVKNIARFVVTAPGQAPPSYEDRYSAVISHLRQDCTIYIKNIPFNAQETDLTSLFEPFGQVVNVRLPRIKQTKHNKGFAFLEMNKSQQVQKILAQSQQQAFFVLGQKLEILPHR